MSEAQERATVASPAVGSTATALGVTAAWAGALALLAAVWIRTPLSGPGPMFVLYLVSILVAWIFGKKRDKAEDT